MAKGKRETREAGAGTGAAKEIGEVAMKDLGLMTTKTLGRVAAYELDWEVRYIAREKRFTSEKPYQVRDLNYAWPPIRQFRDEQSLREELIKAIEARRRVYGRRKPRTPL